MKKILIVLAGIYLGELSAAINTALVSSAAPSTNPLRARAGDCVRGKATVYLEVNNIRAMLLNSGDLWWNRTGSEYEAPARTAQQVKNKARAINPLFAGSVWISGLIGGNLRMAAIRYSANQSAWWPGPIKQGEASIAKAKCEKFDQFWSVTSEDINTALGGGKISQSILEWPGKGNPYLIRKGTFTAEDLAEPLAPFNDKDNDGVYNPEKGDLPSIKNVSQSPNAPAAYRTNKFTFGDQMIFWAINDVGNDHVSPASTPVGAQMNCLAFAFKSSDELNDMTFYTYDIINKSNVTLEQTYMSQYMDADLGNYNDDYVGCDTSRSMGFVYNADDYDENTTVLGYLDQPPVFAADFFEGPKKANGSPIGMSSFVYYINGQGGLVNDPQTEVQYRNFQQGFASNGSSLTISNDCITPGFPTTKYCFTGDPSKPGEWSMCDRNFTPRDLRWLQNSGPFDMETGQTETITIGCIFVRPPKGTHTGCRPLMKLIQDADDKAQRLFDFQFEKSSGPDAPNLKIVETPNKLHFSIENLAGSNNFGENYDAKSIDIPLLSWNKDTTYKFEGYAIYQIVSENAVSNLENLKDPSKAKLLTIMDKKNSINRAINYKPEVVNGQLVTVISEDFKLPNKGIERDLVIERDLFQFEGQSFLINNKTYYYATVAFGYNNFINPLVPTDVQKNQLIFSNSIKIFKGTPHNNDFWGLKTKADYYQGIPVTRKSGQGHGKYFLELEDGEDAKIVTDNSVGELKYKGGKSPISVKVVDPFKLKNAEYKLTLSGSSVKDIYDLGNSNWTLDIKEGADVKTVNSEGRLDRDFSQSIYARVNNQLESYGLAIATSNPDSVSSVPRNGNKTYGYIGGEIKFKDSSKQWLRLVTDADGSKYVDWIRSGAVGDPAGINTSAYNLINMRRVWTDSLNAFSAVLDGRFAPYCLAANTNITAIAAENNYQSFSPGFKWRRVSKDSATMQTWGEGPENTLDSIYSLDLVITNDKEKWSRAVVFETGESEIFTEGGALKGQLRQAPGVGKDGQADGSDKGLGWFPGYAINLETGVRMNIYFGENSRFRGKNAANMVWDPDTTTQTVLGNPLYGGSQFIYIMNTEYSENKVEADRKLLSDNFNLVTGAGNNAVLNTTVANFYRQIAWTCFPLAAKNFSLYNASGEYEIPTDIRIKVRVEKPYAKYLGDESVYEFNTLGLQPTRSDSLVSSAFEKMTVVPNPYYAFSAYEGNATQNVVKIVNVPKNSTVSIFTTDGMLVRRLKLDPKGIVDGQYGDNSSNINYDNTIDWDLRTSSGVLIASGVYYINVEAPGVGSKVLKLFATMRAADVSNF